MSSTDGNPHFLALAGGGARGAYQFGVILGLHQTGISFDGIAGTSVGALNGAVLATGALDDGERFWREMSYRKVYPPTSILLRRLPPAIYNPLVIIFLLLNLLFIPLGKASPMFGMEAVFNKIRFAWAVLFSSAIGATFYAFDPSRPGQSIFIGAMAFPLILTVLFKSKGHGMATTRLGAGAIGLVVLGFLRSPSLVLLLAVALTCGASWLSLIRTTALLDSMPLWLEAKKILRSRQVTCPLTVTLAEEKEVFDPEKGYYRKLPLIGPGGVDFSNVDVDHYPTMRSRWIPKYVEITGYADSENNMRSLIASASLPFGIVNAVNIDGLYFSDGGVCNNFPVSPFLDKNGTVILVHMERKALGRARILAEARNCVQLVTLAAMPKPADMYGKSAKTPPEYQKAMRQSGSATIGDIHEIHPTTSISTRFSFLDLLRFDKAYTNRLINIGIEDGKKAADLLRRRAALRKAKSQGWYMYSQTPPFRLLSPK